LEASLAFGLLCLLVIVGLIEMEMEIKDWNMLANSCTKAAKAERALESLLQLGTNLVKISVTLQNTMYMPGDHVLAKEYIERALQINISGTISNGIELAKEDIRNAKLEIQMYAKDLRWKI
jgi:hypothetical protein